MTGFEGVDAARTDKGRRGPGFGAAAANGIPSHNVAADADHAEASTSERRSNVALQPTGARILTARS